jgi:hypothetical protein
MERRRGTRAYALIHVGAAAQQESHESDTACLVIAAPRQVHQAPTAVVDVVYVASAVGMQLLLRRVAVEVAPHAGYVAVARVNADKSR